MQGEGNIKKKYVSNDDPATFYGLDDVKGEPRYERKNEAEMERMRR